MIHLQLPGGTVKIETGEVRGSTDSELTAFLREFVTLAGLGAVSPADGDPDWLLAQQLRGVFGGEITLIGIEQAPEGAD